MSQSITGPIPIAQTSAPIANCVTTGYQDIHIAPTLVTRKLTFDKCNFPIPPLVYFLNNHLEIIPIVMLADGHKNCIFCVKPMCNEIHRPILPTPASSPEPAHRSRYPQVPHQPSPPLLDFHNWEDDWCPNRTMCEVAVRVTTPGCGHIFGSRCLFKVLWGGAINCPLCHTPWYLFGRTGMSEFRESWPLKLRMEFGFGTGIVVQRK